MQSGGTISAIVYGLPRLLSWREYALFLGDGLDVEVLKWVYFVMELVVGLGHACRPPCSW